MSSFPEKYKTDISIFLFYVLLAIFLTFPLILNIKDSLPLKESPAAENETLSYSDSYYFVWNLWFAKHTLIDLKTSIFSHSDLVFYPKGFDNSATGYDNLLNSLLSIPLQLITANLILAYNILIILNLALSAFAAYILLNYLTKNKKISILGGFMFGFSPYMMARSLHHLELVTTWTIPLFIYFFLKLYKEPKFKNSSLLAFSFLLIALSSWNYALYILFFVFFALLFLEIKSKKSILNKNYLKRFFAFLVLSFLFLSPLILPMAQSYFKGQMSAPQIGDPIAFSADPLSYLTPSPLNSLLGKFINLKLFKSFSSNYSESTAFLGFLEIVTLFIYLQKRKEMGATGHLWIFLLFVFFLLSLGPYFKIGGNVFNFIPLPYYFVYKYLPFFNFARAPVRLSVFIMLFATIVFALTWNHFLSQKQLGQNYKKILFIILAFSLLAERIILPYPIEKIKIPAFYYQIANETEDYAILDLPVGIIGGHRIYNFYQTIHKKKIINGLIKYTSLNPKIYFWIWKDKFLRESMCLPEIARINYTLSFTPNVPQNINDDASTMKKENLIIKLKNVNVKYIIIHKKTIEDINKYESYVSPTGEKMDCRQLESNLNLLFGKKQPFFEDEMIKVYQI